MKKRMVLIQVVLGLFSNFDCVSFGAVEVCALYCSNFTGDATWEYRGGEMHGAGDLTVVEK